MLYYTNKNNMYGILHIMIVSVNFFFGFNSYINSQTSLKLTTDKMQNLPTKQKTEVAYNKLA